MWEAIGWIAVGHALMFGELLMLGRMRRRYQQRRALLERLNATGRVQDTEKVAMGETNVAVIGHEDGRKTTVREKS